jgi:hypothetical protein
MLIFKAGKLVSILAQIAGHGRSPVKSLFIAVDNSFEDVVVTAQVSGGQYFDVRVMRLGGQHPGVKSLANESGEKEERYGDDPASPKPETALN